MPTLERLLLLVEQLAHHRVMVIGDVILDEYVLGNAERMSREAPIPVLELVERRYIAGGAGNPAANIVALGSHALQVGVVGHDDSANRLRHILAERHIQADGLIPCDDRPTTLKTRILAQMGLRFPQQVARIDTLSRAPISPHTEARLIEYSQAHSANVQALLFSDYHGGMLTKTLVNALRHTPNVLLAADAQGTLEKYTRFDLVKCNADDARASLGKSLITDEDFAEGAKLLCEQLALRGAMIITRGASGATIAQADGTTIHCPAPNISNVYDTVGAGDTAIAVMTLAKCAGSTWEEAVTLANYASGIVVQHVGNYTPTTEELRLAMTSI